MANSIVAPANKEEAIYEGPPLREKRRPRGFKKRGKSLRLRGMISEKAAKKHEID